MNLSALPPDTPALQPPLGVISNFDHPYSIRTAVYVTLILCLSISTIFVWLRLYTRFFIIRSHGWDDYTSFIAWAGFVGYVAVGGFLGNKYGDGIHQWDIRLSEFIQFAKVANISEIYYNPLIFITKLSILIQYKKIFVPSNSGITYWSIHALIWLNFLFYFAVMLVQILSCIPREKIWNPTIPGRCVDLPAVLITGAIINIFSDFSILVLPIGKIWKLQLTQRRKLGISAVFTAGLFACISSIVRLTYNVKFAHTEDVTFTLTPVALWTDAEVASGIICGCLPVLPRFFGHYMPKVKKSIHTMTHRPTSQDTYNSAYTSKISKPKELRHNTWDSPGMEGSYIELHEPTLATRTICEAEPRPVTKFSTRAAIANNLPKFGLDETKV